MRLVPMTLESLLLIKPSMFYVMLDSGAVESFRFIKDRLEYWETHDEEWSPFIDISSIHESNYLVNNMLFLITSKDTE